MADYFRRFTLLAAMLMLAVPVAPAAPAQAVSLTLDGVRDSAYVPLAQDATGDLAATLAISTTTNWADLSTLYVVTDTSTLWVYVDLPNYTSNSKGEFGLAIDTDGLSSSGGTQDPNGNPITFAYTSTSNNLGVTPVLTSATLLPDVVIRGILFEHDMPGAGYTDLRTWNPISNTWNGAANNWGGIANDWVGAHIAFALGKGIEFSLPFADLGVAPTQTLNLEFYATDTRAVGYSPGAWDTIPSDNQSLSASQATTEHRLATWNPGAPPQLPKVAFARSGYQTAESAGTVPITITVAPTATVELSVMLATSNGTATAADYDPISQTVSFAPGQAQRVIPLYVLTDTVAESDETALLSLSQAIEAQLGQPYTATLTIHDSPVVSQRKLFLPLLRR